MDTSIKSDTLEVVEATPEVVTTTSKAAAQRSIMLPMQATLRRESRKIEKELKGFYCDWVLDSLNLKR